MVRLQDFSINGLEESGHSPLTVKHVHQRGGRGLERSLLFSHYEILEGGGVLGRSLFLATKGRARLGVFDFL